MRREQLACWSALLRLEDHARALAEFYVLRRAHEQFFRQHNETAN
jgi:hypothetical protein